MLNLNFKIMKTKFFAIILSVFFFAVACEKDDTSNSKISDEFMELSELNMKLQNIRNLNVNSTHEFGAMAMNYNGMKKKACKDGPTNYDDSTYWDDWETCAEYTYCTDEEGFEVMIMDYGEEGCIEWGELIKGKITWKWKMDENGYVYEDIYENYSAWGMTINGYYKGESQWTGSWDWNNFEDSTYFFDWFSEDYEEISTNEEDMTITFEDGEVITYISNFKSKFTFNSYTMLEGSFSYESSLGDTYTWDIIEPVVSDFNCMYWVPVSGIEEGTYNEDTYIIDYGDGTCDNKYTITVNGVTEEIEVDYDDIWICDDEEPSDSTNYGG